MLHYIILNLKNRYLFIYFFDIIIIGSDNMEEELIKKLDKDINCDLSIEEIKLLYSVDIFDNKELYKLRGKRNKEYEDLCKIYNSNLIACTPSEINENTNIYIGSLELDNNYLTYNLKYVYGDLYINDLDNHMHFENLEKVYGIITIKCDDLFYHSRCVEFINNNILYFENMNSYVCFCIEDNNWLPSYEEYVSLKLSYGEIIWNEEIAKVCVINSSDSLGYIPHTLNNYSDIVCLSLEKFPDSIKYVSKDIVDSKISIAIANTNDNMKVIRKYVPKKYYFDLLDCTKYYFVTGYGWDDNSSEKKDLLNKINWIHNVEDFSINISYPLNLLIYKELMEEEYNEELTKRIIQYNPYNKYIIMYTLKYDYNDYKDEKYAPAMKEIIECIPKDRFTYDIGLLIIMQDSKYIKYIPEYVPNYSKLVELVKNEKVKKMFNKNRF